MKTIDWYGAVVDGAHVKRRMGTDRSGAVPRPVWDVICVCGRRFLATSMHIRKVERGTHRHRLRCKVCKKRPQ